MLLDAIFGGGNQQTPPSHPSSSQQPENAAASGNPAAEDASSPSFGGNAEDEPEDEVVSGDNSDGTYGETPSANAEAGSEVEAPSETVIPSDDAPQSQQPPAQAGTPPDTAEQAGTVPPPVTAEPAPIAEDAPAEASAAGVRDFVTPFLAGLDDIRQRQAGGASTSETSGRNRAVAAIQEQLASRLLDELSSESSSARPQQVYDTDEPPAPLSLVNRWYAEA